MTRSFTSGERVRIVGGEHDGRTGTVVLLPFDDLALRVEAEPGETKPTGGRNYCRGGRDGFIGCLTDFNVERLL